MSDSILPADWPHSSNSNSVTELLGMYEGTGVFRKKLNSSGSRSLQFYLPSFNNKQAIAKAIKSNGGQVLQHRYKDSADFIIKPTLTQLHHYSKAGVVCTPLLILRSLQAGRMLNADDFVLKDTESDESESDTADHQLEGEPGAMTRDRSREQSPVAIEETGSAPVSQQTAETPQTQQQRSRLSLTPASSAIADIRYLYADDDELDPDDRYVHEMLSSRSRSIEDLVIGTAESPDSRRSRSVDISDNDFRVKAKLDAAARDPCEMLDLVLVDSPADSLADSPASSPRLGPQSVNKNERPKDSNRASRTPSPQPPPTGHTCFPSPSQQTTSETMFSRIKRLFMASQDTNASLPPSPSISKQPLSANDRKLRYPKTPIAINTQYSQGSSASSGLSMEGTPERSASPELAMPSSQAPLSPDFAYIQLSNATFISRARSPASSQLRLSQPRPEIGLELADPSDEEYPDPSQFLAHRILRSESPELGSLLSASRGINTSARDASKAKQPPMPHMTISSGEEEPALPVAKPAKWTGLGKRRRTSDKGSGYGHRPVPVVIEDGGGDDEPTSPYANGQSSFLSQQRRLPITNKSQSVDSLLDTPTARRIRMRAVPFSPSKRIRMSTCDSPEANSGGISTAPQRIITDISLEAATAPAIAAASNGTARTAAPVVPATTIAADLGHTVTASLGNCQSNSLQPQSLVPVADIAGATASDSLGHRAQASTAAGRPKLPMMPTESTVSAASTQVLDSPSRHASDTEEPDVAISPLSEPLVISGLFAKQGAALDSPPDPLHGHSNSGLASAREGVDTSRPALDGGGRSSAEREEGEASPGALGSSQRQPVPDSSFHLSDASYEVDDAENDADDDASDGGSAKDTSDVEQLRVVPSHAANGELTSTAHDTPEPSVDPASNHEGEQAWQHPASKHLSSVPPSVCQDASEQAESDFWRIDDATELPDLVPERTPQMQHRLDRVRPASLQPFKSPARMGNGITGRTADAISKTQPRATRSRRASTLRIVSTCQRLLMLHSLGDSGSGVHRQLGDGLLNSRALLGSDALGSSHLASHDSSNAPSPSRRAQFSGAMRVFGESAPEMNDSERLGYLRKLKGLMIGTGLTPKQAMAALYRCTGDWVIARKLIISGEASVPSGCVWSAEDDQALQQGMDLDKMEELRQEKGNVEVYRRLQFLNTFYSSKA
ncbi:hypothetical protein GGI20_000884 [Coemansia sp. BCRC 34301]|nr:hypothetical protein GGI20_000884 [Coemansia sp. BCRC 34301]